MAHEFSFSRRQWWIAVTCSVLMVILIFAVGFVGGAMWQSARPVSHFDYRAMSPVFHTERFTVNGNPSPDGSGAEVWTANSRGAIAMTGKVRFG